MKKFAITTVLAVALILSYGVTVGYAQDGAEAEAKPESVGVKIVGVNYCVLCALANDEVAGANTSYAKLNALKVTEAKDVDGNVLADLVGKTLHYLPSKAAEPLLVGEGLAGKNVTITVGVLFKNENALLVEEYEAEESGDDDDWDELPLGGKSGLQVL